MNNFSLRQSCSSLLHNLDSHFPLVQQAVAQLTSSTLGSCPTACWIIKKLLPFSPYQGKVATQVGWIDLLPHSEPYPLPQPLPPQGGQGLRTVVSAGISGSITQNTPLAPFTPCGGRVGDGGNSKAESRSLETEIKTQLAGLKHD